MKIEGYHGDSCRIILQLLALYRLVKAFLIRCYGACCLTGQGSHSVCYAMSEYSVPQYDEISHKTRTISECRTGHLAVRWMLVLRHAYQ